MKRKIRPKTCEALSKMSLVSVHFSGSTENRWSRALWNCDGSSLAGMSRMHLPLVWIFGRQTHTGKLSRWIHILYMQYGWNHAEAFTYRQKALLRWENNTKFQFVQLTFLITQFSWVWILVPNAYFSSHLWHSFVYALIKKYRQIIRPLICWESHAI